MNEREGIKNEPESCCDCLNSRGPAGGTTGGTRRLECEHRWRRWRVRFRSGCRLAGSRVRSPGSRGAAGMCAGSGGDCTPASVLRPSTSLRRPGPGFRGSGSRFCRSAPLSSWPSRGGLGPSLCPRTGFRRWTRFPTLPVETPVSGRFRREPRPAGGDAGGPHNPQKIAAV